MRLKSFFRLIILVSFIQSVSSTAQTVEYDVEVSSLPSIHEIFDDGSLHTTKIEENSTFYLDSISPYGVNHLKGSLTLYDSVSYIKDYKFIDTSSVIISYSEVFGIDCGSSKIIKYNIHGDTIWEFIDDTLVCNVSPSNIMIYKDDYLFSVSQFQEEGECFPENKLLKLDINTGQLLTEKSIGSCEYFTASSGLNNLKLIHRRNCFCSEINLYPDLIETYDFNLNLTSVSKVMVTETNGDSLISINTSSVDTNTVIAKTLGNLLMRFDNTNLIASYSLSDTLNLNKYMSRLYDVVVYDTFYLIAFGHNYTNLVRPDEYYRYDSTEVNIICVTKDFTQIGNIWTEVKLGEVYHLNLEHHFISEDDGSLYLTYSKNIGTSINRESKSYIERISFNSIINSVESEFKSNELTFEVYPNPTLGEINIETTNSGKLEFYDLAGKRQLVSNINAGSNKLEINQLPVGVYFLVLTTEDGNRTTQKLIIQ